MIGRPHGVFIVLNNDHGVALIAEILQASQQHRIVARVQTDGRLVQNVDNPHKPAADLSGQSNPLRFSTGQRRRRTMQRQIVQPALQQEPQAASNFFQCFFSNVLLSVIQFERRKKIGGFRDRQRAYFGQTQFFGVGVLPAEVTTVGFDANVAGLLVKSFTTATLAGHNLQMLFDLTASHRVL